MDEDDIIINETEIEEYDLENAPVDEDATVDEEAKVDEDTPVDEDASEDGENPSFGKYERLLSGDSRRFKLSGMFKIGSSITLRT